MARNRKRKTNRVTVPKDSMKAAVVEVVDKQRPLKTVATEFGIERTTLRRDVKKYVSLDRKDEVRFEPKYQAQLIFDDQEETMLADYFVTAASYNYGQSPTMARRLAYEYALANDKIVPHSWLRDSTAGEEWLTGFLKRHPDLSIRSPEGTSIGRSTAFNRDETGLTTVYNGQQK